MRNLYEPIINRYRLTGKSIIEQYGHSGDAKEGAFIIPSPIDKEALRCLASSDEGWDHVSVSRTDRCPNWDEMEHVKRIFFHPYELALQFHVPETKHINIFPFCLHLWRPWFKDVPLPPQWMV